MTADLAERKAKKQAYMKAWREANKDRINAYKKQWVDENRDHVQEYNKVYMPQYVSKSEAQFSKWMRNLHRNYRMTPEQFNEIWTAQDGKCGICKTDLQPRGRSKNSASVDHNHHTGEVRGILCQGCNRGIGNLGDDPENMMRAAQYLLQKGNYKHLKGK